MSGPASAGHAARPNHPSDRPSAPPWPAWTRAPSRASPTWSKSFRTATSSGLWHRASGAQFRPRASWRSTWTAPARCPTRASSRTGFASSPPPISSRSTPATSTRALANAAHGAPGDVQPAVSEPRLDRSVVRRRRRAARPGHGLLEHTGRVPAARSYRAADRHAGRQRPRRPYGRRRAATATTASTTPPAKRRLLSQAVGKPVRVQWMRQDEHVWEPHGPAMAGRRARRGRQLRATSAPGTTRSGRRRTAPARAVSPPTCCRACWSARRHQPPRTASVAATATRRPTTPSPTTA